MKRFSFVFVFLSILLFISCKPILNQFLGVNRQKQLSSKVDYIDYVVPKYVLDKSNIYNASGDAYYQFMGFVMNSKADIYYGTFLDSITRFKSSDFYDENKSCLGRIVGDIKSHSNGTLVDSVFLNVNLVNVMSNKRFYPVEHKQNIVLLFSTKLGNIHRKDLINIQKQFCDTSKFKLVLISMDNF